MTIEEDIDDFKRNITIIDGKLNKIIEHTVQEKKDVSKLLREIKELVVKGKPPRKQPKKKEEHQDDDHCECGGILNPDIKDEKGIMRYKCEDCGKECYNERDL